ncbi:MAG: TrmB family transcriptional regulator sugar-binding domain-containing protein, partial [archaeon]
VLNSLEKKGFTIIQLGRPVKYAPVKPEIVVEKLKQGAEKDYTDRLSHYENIGSSLRKELGKISGKQKEPSGDAISIIRGEDNINNHIKSMITTANRQIVKITDDDGLDRLHKEYRTHFTSAKNRGVKTRIITKNHKAKIPDGFKNFAETRHNKKVDGRLMVKDGKESFLLTSPDVGILVKGKYLANSLEQMFEHAWNSGTVF